MAIQLRRNSTSGIVPHSTELVSGEVAINTADLELYAEDTAGTVAQLARNTYPAVKPPSGQWQTGMSGTDSTTTRASYANRVWLHPWIPRHTVTVDRAAIWCTAAVAGSLAKIAIFDSDADGWPTGSALWTSTDLNCGTTGEKSATVSLTLRRGQQYWNALHTSSTQTVRAMFRTGFACIQSAPSDVYPYANAYVTSAYGSGMPSAPAYASLSFDNGNVPLIYWRTA